MSCNDIVIMVLLWIHKLPAVEEFILHLVLPHVREGEVRGPPWNVIPRLLLAGEGGGGSIKEEERGGRGGGGGGREGRGKKEGKGGGGLRSIVEPWKTRVSYSCPRLHPPYSGAGNWGRG